MASIFDKIRLRPSQLRTVAERRYDDADYLRGSRSNKHANGAMYLGGFVLECLLKARLLEDHPWLKAPPAKMSGKSPGERQLISLCYHKHDLTGILERLSSKTLDRLENLGHLDTIKKLCGEWTIYARYSPRMADIGEASNFLNRIREVKKCLG